VAVRGPDVNRSGERYLVEEGSPPAIRVSLAQVKGMRRQALAAVLASRETAGPIASLDDFIRRCCPPVTRDVVENLVLVGAFDALDGNRRRLLWRLPVLLGERRGTDADRRLLDEVGGAPDGVRDFTPEERMRHEYDLLGFSPEHHLLAYLRPRLAAAGFVPSSDLVRLPPGRLVKVGGLPVRPHRPPTKTGRTIVFLSLEDEAGLAEVTIFEGTYQRYGRLLFTDPCPPLAVEGKLERRDKAVSVIARRVDTLYRALEPSWPA